MTSWRQKLQNMLGQVPLLIPALTVCCVIGWLLGSEGAWMHWWQIGLGLCLTLAVLARLWGVCVLSVLCGGTVMLMQEAHDSAFHAARTTALQSASAPVAISGSIYKELRASYVLRDDTTGMNYGIVLPEDADRTPSIGEKWKCRGRLTPYRKSRGLGTFDVTAWAERNSMIALMRADTAEYVSEGDTTSRFLGYSATWRARLKTALDQDGADNPATQVVIAAMLGDKSGAEEEVVQVFRESGSLHIFAVSGMHVALLAGILYWMARTLRAPMRAAQIIVLVVLTAYVFITGMPASAVRAWVIVVLFIIGKMIYRKVHSLNLLALAALLLLMTDYNRLGEAGFQLSFSVYAGVLAAAWVVQKLPVWGTPDKFVPIRIYTRTEKARSWCASKTQAIVIVSIAAWLVSIPLCAMHFQSWSRVAPLTNVLMAPLVPVMMFCGLMSITFMWCNPILSLCNAAARFVAAGLLAIAEWSSSIHGAYSHVYPSVERGSVVVMPLPYGGECVAVSNPALILGELRASDWQYTVSSNFKHLRIKPWANVVSAPPATQTTRQKNAAAKERIKAIAAAMPPRHTIPTGHSLKYPISYSGGNLTAERPCVIESPLFDYAPITRGSLVYRWQVGVYNLLYTGQSDAQRIIHAPIQGRADVLIIGSKLAESMTEWGWMQNLQPQVIIFPSAIPAELANTMPKVKFHSLDQAVALIINLEGETVQIIPVGEAKTAHD